MGPMSNWTLLGMSILSSVWREREHVKRNEGGSRIQETIPHHKDHIEGKSKISSGWTAYTAWFQQAYLLE